MKDCKWDHGMRCSMDKTPPLPLHGSKTGRNGLIKDNLCTMGAEESSHVHWIPHTVILLTILIIIHSYQSPTYVLYIHNYVSNLCSCHFPFPGCRKSKAHLPGVPPTPLPPVTCSSFTSMAEGLSRSLSRHTRYVRIQSFHLALAH